MLASWTLDTYTVMRLDSGRRGDEVLKVHLTPNFFIRLVEISMLI